MEFTCNTVFEKDALYAKQRYVYSKYGSMRLVNPGIDLKIWGTNATVLTNVEENAYIWELRESNIEQDY